jgi:hypothetical protein
MGLLVDPFLINGQHRSLTRIFRQVERAAVGRREKEAEGGRRSGKARVADQTAGMTERASTPLSICLSEHKIA